MKFKLALTGFVLAYLTRLIEGFLGLKDYTLLLPILITIIGYQLMRSWRLRRK